MLCACRHTLQRPLEGGDDRSGAAACACPAVAGDSRSPCVPAGGAVRARLVLNQVLQYGGLQPGSLELEHLLEDAF